MLVAMLRTCDTNVLSGHVTNTIGGATVLTNLIYTLLITFMCNIYELYFLIQDLIEILFIFSEFVNFQSCAENPGGGDST